MPQGDMASSGVDSTQARMKPLVESASCLGHQHLLELSLLDRQVGFHESPLLIACGLSTWSSFQGETPTEP
jgi:hypothetical protein